MPLAPALRGQSIRAKADVRLIGDQEASEDVHSVLLMTLSPYFQILLSNRDQSSAANDGTLVRIEGADGEILKLIKEYAYEGKLTGLSGDNVARVHRVADMYNIIGILNECDLYQRKQQQQQQQQH